jgi:hypothetical protein
MKTQPVANSQHLLASLLSLPHAEKLRMINLLLREVAAEEGVSLEPGEAKSATQENYVDQLLENPLKTKDFKRYKLDEMIEPANTRLADFLAFTAKHRVKVDHIAIPNRDERNAR